MAAIEERLHTLAFNQFHGDEVQAVLFAGVVYDDNIWVGQQSRRARFGLESSQEFRTRQSGAFFAQADGLHRDITADDGIHCTVNDTHGAAAQLSADFVPPRLYHRRHANVTTPEWRIPLP